MRLVIKFCGLPWEFIERDETTSYKPAEKQVSRYSYHTILRVPHNILTVPHNILTVPHKARTPFENSVYSTKSK